MRPFRWHRPESLGEALELLADLGGEGQPIAGGQSLLLAMKAREASPAHLIALARIDDLRGVSVHGGDLVIGPITTYADLERGGAVDGGLRRHIHAVVSQIADTAVRSMATVGGAACQADPAFDVPVMLTACDARLALTSSSGARELACEEFFIGHGATARHGDELLQAVRIPLANTTLHGFAKFGPRAHDAALASVALALRVGRDDGGGSGARGIEAARIVVGGCVERPTRAPEVERWLVGQAPAAAASQIGDAIAEEIEPTISTSPFSAAYRRRLLVGLGRRAMLDATAANGSAT
jgi:aerobic carbon-monoxide dehydrogenase medium subunit